MSEKIKVFIASSNDLAEERKNLENLLHRKKIFEPILWENLAKGIEENSFQDTLNEKLIDSQIVIFMIKSRLGKFTLKEFQTAYKHLGKGIEKIHVCFFPIKKGTPPNEKKIIIELQEFLDKEGKIYEECDNYTEFENYILEQIDILKDEIPEENLNSISSSNCGIEEIFEEVLYALYDFFYKDLPLQPAMKLELKKLKYIKIKYRPRIKNQPIRYCINITDDGAKFLENNTEAILNRE